MRRSVVTFFLIITLGLIASYMLIISYVMDNATEMEQEVLKGEAQVLAEHIEGDLSEQSMIVRQMANYEAIVDYMGTLTSREEMRTHPRYPEVLHTLRNINSASSSKLLRVYFVSAPGDAGIDHQGMAVPPGWTLQERQWYLDTVAHGDIFITDPYADAGSGGMVVTIAYPVFRQGMPIGATALDVMVDDITAGALKHSIGPRGYLIIADRKGTILLHPQRQMLLKALTDLPEFQYKDILGSKTGVTEFFSDGEEKISAYCYLPMSGWTIIAVQSKEYAMRKLMDIKQVIAGVFIAVFILLGAVTKLLLSTLENLSHTQNSMLTAEKMASLGRLVAGVSHEINTPLGVAVTAVSFLKEVNERLETELRQGSLRRAQLYEYMEETRESCDIALANIMNVSRLVKSFKQVSADQSSDVRRVFNLKVYLAEILMTLHPVLKKTRHVITVHCDEDIEIYTMPGAITQIVTNLLMNSLLHAYEPEQAGSISIDVRENYSSYILTYRDDGKGMTEMVRSRIFEPFFTTNIGGGGTGLGMYLVYNIVTLQLKGSITCQSSSGQGTCFIIEIPQEKKTVLLAQQP